MPEDDKIKVVARNKRARYDYQILDVLEAGLVLKGTEVKSIRDGKVSIAESYARMKGSEIFVFNMDVTPYTHAVATMNHEPKRPRKLLLQRREIERLYGKLAERGLTLIPLSLYFKKGYAKLEIGLARGRKKYDKREKIEKRASDRELRKRMARE